MENNKSRGLKVASRLVGYIGVAVCMIAAIAYLLMHQLGYQIKFIGAFEWTHIIYVGAVALGFILIAVILRIASRVAAKKAVDVEEDNCIEEVVEEDVNCVEEVCEECESCESCEAVEEAADATGKCKVCQVIKEKLSPENREKIVAAVKKNAPVIVAVAATATAAVVIGKIVSDRKKAKIRRHLLDLLY